MGNKSYVVAIKTQLATEETRRTGEIISTGVEKEKKEKDKKNWLCQRKVRGEKKTTKEKSNALVHYVRVEKIF